MTEAATAIPRGVGLNEEGHENAGMLSPVRGVPIQKDKKTAASMMKNPQGPPLDYSFLGKITILYDMMYC